MADSQDIDFSRAMTVGEVAKRSGVPVSTLHFYERKGLIQSHRSSGNQRRYPALVLRYIAIIKAAQRTGIALEDIGAMLSQFPPGTKLSAAQWRTISSRWRAQLDQRIVQLTRLRDELDQCIGCGCLSMKDCPLRNPGDVLGQQGSGARILERPADGGQSGTNT